MAYMALSYVVASTSNPFNLPATYCPSQRNHSSPFPFLSTAQDLLHFLETKTDQQIPNEIAAESTVD